MEAMERMQKEMIERIAKIIASEGLTQSEFAESIGTGNATITHILSGRNRVSLDIITKILTAYPKYNTDWLIQGKGEIYKQPVQTSIFDVLGEEPQPESGSKQEEPNASVTTPLNAVSEPAEPQPANSQQIPQTQPQTPVIEPQKVVERIVAGSPEIKQIVVLYTDGTFAAYNRQ